MKGKDMATVAERVQRGIELLNERGPKDWLHEIDIESLKIVSACRCVLGQLFFSRSLTDIFETPFDVGVTELLSGNYTEAFTHGFNVNTDNYEDIRGLDDDADYEALQAEWVRRLTELQAK